MTITFHRMGNVSWNRQWKQQLLFGYRQSPFWKEALRRAFRKLCVSLLIDHTMSSFHSTNFWWQGPWHMPWSRMNKNICFHYNILHVLLLPNNTLPNSSTHPNFWNVMLIFCLVLFIHRLICSLIYFWLCRARNHPNPVHHTWPHFKRKTNKQYTKNQNWFGVETKPIIWHYYISKYGDTQCAVKEERFVKQFKYSSKVIIHKNAFLLFSSLKFSLLSFFFYLN